MTKPTSRLRHNTLQGLIKLCQDKEKSGWECIVPVQQHYREFKHFKNRNGRMEYGNTSASSYWEAIYRRCSNERIS